MLDKNKLIGFRGFQGLKVQTSFGKPGAGSGGQPASVAELITCKVLKI